MHLFWLPNRRGFLPHTLFCGGIVDQFQEERQVRARSSGHEREISAAENRHREVSIVQRGGQEIDFGLLRCSRGAAAAAAAKPIIFTVKSGELILGLACSQSCGSVLPALLSTNRNRWEFSK